MGKVQKPNNSQHNTLLWECFRIDFLGCCS